jgi:hypothetical protein
MKKQTAVEWYNTQLNLYGDMAFNKVISLGEYHIKKQELLEQAKQMEHEQIIKSNRDGVDMDVDHTQKFQSLMTTRASRLSIKGEDDYNETYRETKN